eukprot:12936370-Prorocentrum_lima.AAC.1
MGQREPRVQPEPQPSNADTARSLESLEKRMLHVESTMSLETNHEEMRIMRRYSDELNRRVAEMRTQAQ